MSKLSHAITAILSSPVSDITGITGVMFITPARVGKGSLHSALKHQRMTALLPHSYYQPQTGYGYDQGI